MGKHYSTCCEAPLKQKMLWLDKVVTDTNFKIVTSGKEKKTHKVPVTKKLFWKIYYITIKPITRTFIKQNVKDVQFRYFCTKCDKQNNGKWDFKLEDKDG